jgi:hypothetical protein
MTTVLITYCIAWGAIGAYTAWLAIGDLRLRQRKASFESTSASRSSIARQVTTAA